MQTVLKMKIKSIFLAGLAAVALTSCEGLFYNPDGKAIVFSAAAGSDARTRTQYSGEVENGKERIDWKDGDQVRIYMYLENAPGYTFDNTDSDYIVNWQENAGEISRGRLSAKNETTTLRWVGNAADKVSHMFYSIYPATYSGDLTKDDTGVRVNFQDLANQDNTMNYAYMAAVAGPYTTDGEKSSNKNEVDLNYYPMITTVYVTVKNDTGSDVSNIPVKFASTNSEKPLAGPFSVQLNGDGDFTPVINPNGNGFVSELTKTISSLGKGESEYVMFFLLPQDYRTSDLVLSLPKKGSTDFVKYSLREANKNLTTLYGRHKYNISVSLKGGDLTIDDLTPAGLQMAFAFLRYGKVHVKNEYWEGYSQIDGNLLYPYFQKLYPDSNDFLNKFWNSKFKHIGEKLPNVTEEDRKLLTDEEWQIIMYFLSTIDEFIIDSGSYINASFTEKDLSFLPNLEVLHFQYDDTSKDNAGGINISLSGISKLREVRLQGNALLNLTINNCYDLQKVDLSKLNTSKAYKVTIDGCPNLTTIVDIPNNNVWTKTVTNCNSSVNTK